MPETVEQRVARLRGAQTETVEQRVERLRGQQQAPLADNMEDRWLEQRGQPAPAERAGDPLAGLDAAAREAGQPERARDTWLNRSANQLDLANEWRGEEGQPRFTRADTLSHPTAPSLGSNVEDYLQRRGGQLQADADERERGYQASPTRHVEPFVLGAARGLGVEALADAVGNPFIDKAGEERGRAQMAYNDARAREDLGPVGRTGLALTELGAAALPIGRAGALIRGGQEVAAASRLGRAVQAGRSAVAGPGALGLYSGATAPPGERAVAAGKGVVMGAVAGPVERVLGRWFKVVTPDIRGLAAQAIVRAREALAGAGGWTAGGLATGSEDAAHDAGMGAMMSLFRSGRAVTEHDAAVTYRAAYRAAVAERATMAGVREKVRDDMAAIDERNAQRAIRRQDLADEMGAAREQMLGEVPVAALPQGRSTQRPALPDRGGRMMDVPAERSIDVGDTRGPGIPMPEMPESARALVPRRPGPPPYEPPSNTMQGPGIPLPERTGLDAVKADLRGAEARRAQEAQQYREGIGQIPEAPRAVVESVPRRLSEEAGFLGLGPNRPPLAGGGAQVGDVVAGTLKVPERVGSTLLGAVGRVPERSGGMAGSVVNKNEAKAEINAKAYRGEVSAEAERMARASQGASPLDWRRASRDKQAASVEAQKPVDHGDYADSQGREWVEQNAGTRSAAEAEIKASEQDLLRATWNAQDRRGFKIDRGQGEVRMGQIAGPGKTRPYQNNDLGREIELEGPTHSLWQERLAAHVAKNAGRMTPDAVERQLLQESADAKEGKFEGNEGHIASEFGRKMLRPDFIKNKQGKFVPVQEVNPFKVGQRLVESGGRTVGAQMVYGRGSRSRVNALREAYVKAGGNARDFDTALRGQFGLADPPGRVASRMTPAVGGGVDIASRGYDLLGDNIRTGVRTGSAAWQLPDQPFGNQTVMTGAKHTAIGIFKTVRDFFTRGRSAEKQELVRRGTETVNVPDYSIDIHKDIAPGWRRSVKWVGEKTAKPFDEAQESTANYGGNSWTRELLAKAGRWNRFTMERFATRLKAFADIEPDVTRRVLRGGATPAQQQAFVDQIMSRGVSRATGSNVEASQRSFVDTKADPVMRKAFAFYKWFSNNLATSGRVLKANADAFRTGDMTQKAAATVETMRFITYKALNGAASQMLAAFLLPGGRDIDDEMRAFKNDPMGYLFAAALKNAAAGTVGNFVSGSGLSFENTLPGRIKRTFFDKPVEAVKAGVTDRPAAGVKIGVKEAERAVPLLRLDPGGDHDPRRRRR